LTVHFISGIFALQGGEVQSSVRMPPPPPPPGNVFRRNVGSMRPGSQRWAGKY